MHRLAALPLLLVLAACEQGELSAPPTDERIQVETEEPALDEAGFPTFLAAFGDGYPAAGDPCRHLGESVATNKWRSEGDVLVGCPSFTDATALEDGRIVEKLDTIQIVAIPIETATRLAGVDALVEGTDYNATAALSCGMDNSEPTQSCLAGVKRQWGEDGTTLLEITKPDGMPRAFFWLEGRVVGAATAEADGSAGFELTPSRVGEDTTRIEFGPETYLVPDALILGG